MRETMDHDPKDQGGPGPADNSGGSQLQQGDPNPADIDAGDDGMELNPDDIEEVIDLPEGGPEEGNIAGEMGDMDLQNYDADADEDEADEDADSGMEASAAPPRDDAQTVFEKHAGSVFCVALGGEGDSLAVSGGEDDKAFVWKTGSGEVVLECTGHKDSVTCACFSHNSSYVATGDMSGIIKVWKIDTAEEVWSFETSDLEWLEWHHSAPVLLAGTADGECWMWKIPAGDTKTFQGHGCVCSTGTVLPDGKRLVAGYEDGTVKVWDLKGANALQSFSGHTGHKGSIVSLDCHSDGNVVITGSTDVTAKLLNVSNGKLLGTFNCAASVNSEADDSVEAVGFSKVQNLAATGTLSGGLSFWDVATQVQRHQCQHEAGIVRLKWDSSAPVVYTCTLDGVVNLWDARTGKRESDWLGHQAEILDMSLASNGASLVTGSGDGTARVFKLQPSNR